MNFLQNLDYKLITICELDPVNDREYLIHLYDACTFFLKKTYSGREKMANIVETIFLPAAHLVWVVVTVVVVVVATVVRSCRVGVGGGSSLVCVIPSAAAVKLGSVEARADVGMVMEGAAGAVAVVVLVAAEAAGAAELLDETTRGTPPATGKQHKTATNQGNRN